MFQRIIDRETPEGRRLKATLQEMSNMTIKVGYQAGESTEENGADTCQVAAWNEFGTRHMPSRPFMRQSIDNNLDKIKSFLTKEMGNVVDGASAQETLNRIGVFQKTLIQETIRNGDFVPNAPSTIRRKGSSKPLIDTGQMRQSVNYVIESKWIG